MRSRCTPTAAMPCTSSTRCATRTARTAGSAGCSSGRPWPGLTPREKRIMELRYLKGKTQMEVAQEIGISQAQVSRLEKAALESVPSQSIEQSGAPAPSIRRRAGGAALLFGIFRRVAAPPRRCRSALLRASTACTCAGTAPGLTRPQPHRNVLVHGGLAAPERRAPPPARWPRAPRCTLPAARARCSGSAFMTARLPASSCAWYSICAGRGDYVRRGLTFVARRAILEADIKTGAP